MKNVKKILVCGAGGFIGSHLVKKLKNEGHWVRGVDLKYPDFSKTAADDFVIADLRKQKFYQKIFDTKFDEVYQLAADMGGADYIFTGEHDADIMHNSALINLNMIEACAAHKVQKVFYSSSACIYPEHNQLDPSNPKCSEASAYPANPDSEYGWEKLFSERLYLAFQKNYGIQVRVARFHNIFGEEGTWQGGKEKAPAAICRKVAESIDGGTIEVYGDGNQTRTFLHISECLEGIQRLMNSEFSGPVNIGSDELVSINQLAQIVAKIANKKINIDHVKGPTGVRGRTSDNNLIKEKLSWQPSKRLASGLELSYKWINQQVNKKMDKKSA